MLNSSFDKHSVTVFNDLNGQWHQAYSPRAGVEISLPITACEFEFGPEAAEAASDVSFAEMLEELAEGRAVRLVTPDNDNRWWVLAAASIEAEVMELRPDQPTQ